MAIASREMRGGRSAGARQSRALLVALGAAVWLACFPPTVLGATAYVDPTQGSSLFYVASAGEANQVEVTRDGAGTTIRDPGAVITAGSGCTSVSPTEVFCAGSDTEAARVVLGDGDDAAAVVEGGGVVVLGGPGGDELNACETCSALLSGGTGNDMLTGGDQAGLHGQEGADTLIGDASLHGGPGSDSLTGNSDLRVMDGGRGDDTITGGDLGNHILPGSGDDTIAAGDGDDRVVLDKGEDNVDGGPGRDSVDLFRLWVPLMVDLRRDRAIVGGRRSLRIRLVSIADVRGTARSDRLIGDGHDNVLDGAGGQDELVGNGGDDVFRTGDGVVRPASSGLDDFLRGGAGDDLLQAGRGDDFLEGGSGEDRLEGQAGDDVILARDGASDVVRGGRQLDRAGVDASLDDVRDVEIFF
ncbi:MAG TPA: calcium-binding protein [Gaiellaceae bacterium]|nr:calcium-binding protein [Gaiellaceae bacterium]